MHAGTTKIKPDSTNDVPLNGVNGNYSDAGSYSRNITYTGGATIRQMSALAALSTSCRQKFIVLLKKFSIKIEANFL